jgi:hypothetical protein
MQRNTKIGILCGVLLCYLLAVVAIFVTNPHTPPPPIVKIVVDPLEEAIKSVGAVRFEFNSGTFVLIGREHQANGKYLYHALTDHHIIKHGKDSSQDPTNVMIAIRPDFHKPMVVKPVKITAFDWEVPVKDWAVFSFELDVKLPCAIFASKEQFDSIGPFDTIYGVGCDNGFGLLCRTGNIGSTDNVHPFSSVNDDDEDQCNPSLPWDADPEEFFRPMQPCWFGASGGGIFDAEGRLIGTYEALIFGGHHQPVPHSGVAHKTYCIFDLLKNSTMLGVKD